MRTIEVLASHDLDREIRPRSWGLNILLLEEWLATIIVDYNSSFTPRDLIIWACGCV
jgi:hypothetical protein